MYLSEQIMSQTYFSCSQTCEQPQLCKDSLTWRRLIFCLVFCVSPYLPLSFMCVPSVDGGKSPPIPYVYVNSSGSVKNYRPMQVVLACSLEMYAFPFDKQNCSLTFRSWLHSGLWWRTQHNQFFFQLNKPYRRITQLYKSLTKITPGQQSFKLFSSSNEDWSWVSVKTWGKSRISCLQALSSHGFGQCNEKWNIWMKSKHKILLRGKGDEHIYCLSFSTLSFF